MKCKQCNVEVSGRQLYCSDKCKQEAYRNRSTVTTVTDVTVTPTVTRPEPVTVEERTASYQDYIDNPDDYATRANAAALRWGEWMAMDELAEAGYKANRVTIPGDWDYVGSYPQV